MRIQYSVLSAMSFFSMALVGCATKSGGGDFDLRNPASQDRPVATQSLDQLLRSGANELARHPGVRKISEGREELSRQEAVLRKTLAVEGLSEETKKAITNDIARVAEKNREASRLLPEETISKRRLGPEHLADMVKIFNAACPEGKIWMKDDFIFFKEKQTTVSAPIDFSGTKSGMGHPYINFVADGDTKMVTRVGLNKIVSQERQKSGPFYDGSIGGEIVLYFNSTGEFDRGGVEVREFVKSEATFFERMFNNPPPERIKSHYYHCRAKR